MTSKHTKPHWAQIKTHSKAQKYSKYGERNECIPPRVGLHHHLHEKCEECEGEDTMSGVQHAAKGPANRPTHTTEPQLHNAADLEKKKGDISEVNL